MVWLFLAVAIGAGLFALPGGGRSRADRRVAQMVAMTAGAAVFLTLKLLPLGLLMLVVGAGLYGTAWLKEKLTSSGFQDLNEEARARPPRRPTQGMSREEALSVLGLSDTADDEAVQSAHRRMISKAHPDRGGSDYLAAKVNEARDVLLG